MWDDQVAEKQRTELEEANVSEKELWTELLRLARTNFSEAYMVLTHLKVIRSFVESVLRYGLPAEYFGIAVKVGGLHTSSTFIAPYADYCPSCSRIQSGQRQSYPHSSHTTRTWPPLLLIRRERAIPAQATRCQVNTQHCWNKKNGLLSSSNNSW